MLDFAQLFVKGGLIGVYTYIACAVQNTLFVYIKKYDYLIVYN